MKFTFEGKEYYLQFERDHKNVEVFKQRQKHIIKSTHPYTTVRLYELMPSVGGVSTKLSVAAATVGCFPGTALRPGDFYTNSKGRLHAMKDLSLTLSRMKFPKQFVKAMWQAYDSRAGKQEQPVIEGQIIQAPETNTNSPDVVN